MKFSIWYNEQEDFSDIIQKYHAHISTVYFPMFYWLISSWRNINQHTDDLLVYFKKVLLLMKECNKYWIETDLLLNWTCEWKNTSDEKYFKSLIPYIKILKKNWLSTITLVNFMYINILKENFPDIKICASLNAYVKTLEHSVHLKNMWVDIITVDSDINYDLKLIKKIKDRTWLAIKVIVNDPCIAYCPYRMTHFNMIAHEAEVWWGLLETIACWEMVENNKRLFFRIPFVRPEDLHNYDFVDYLKLATRDLTTKEIDFLLWTYISQKYDWNLLDLIGSCIPTIPEVVKYIDNSKLSELNFFEQMTRCPNDCDSCTNCDKFFDL